MKKIIVVNYILLILVWVSNVNSMGTLPLPATEGTQLMNFGTLLETVSEARKQVQRLASIVKQNIMIIEGYKREALTIPDLIWKDTSATLRELVDTKRRAEGLICSVKNVDEDFKQKFKGYKYWLKHQSVDFNTQYSKWNKDYLTSAKDCLRQCTVSSEITDNQRKAVSKMQDVLSTVSGRNQLLQATTNIEDQQLKKLDQLNEIVTAQAQMQATFKVNEKEIESLKEAKKDIFYKQSPNRPIIGNGTPFP